MTLSLLERPPDRSGSIPFVATSRLGRRHLFYLFLIYLIFVIYGSLVPFEPRSYSFEEAWSAFLNIPYLKLGAGARVDWIANLLLYIPLAFLGCAWATSPRESAFANGWRIVGVFVFCAAVTVTLEFTQIFFAPRTVSLNDVIAELLGTLIGVAFWLLGRWRLYGIWIKLSQGGRPALVSAVTVYVFIYLSLAFFPFDFFVSLDGISAKLATDGYGWLLSAKCPELIRCTAKYLIDIIVLIPLGFMLGMLWDQLAYRKAFFLGVGVGALTEIGQLFLESGVWQGPSLLTRGVGVVAGVWLARALCLHGISRIAWWVRRLTWLALPAYLIALGLVSGWFTQSWLDVDTALERLSIVRFIPFYYHYYVSETRAMASLLATMGMYFPIGIVAWARWWTNASASRANAIAPALVAATIAGVVEMGKLFVPLKRPDFTDVLIAAAAAAGAFCILVWATQRLSGEPKATVDRRDSHVGTAPARSKEVDRGTLTARLFAISLAGLAVTTVIQYPVGAPWLGVGLALYAVLIFRWPLLWVLIVPALAPLLDFAPITGRLWFDEFDLLLLVTVAITLWRPPAHAPQPWSDRILPSLFGLFAISWAIATMRAVWAAPALNFAAFASSHSQWDALRVGKGILWAIVLLPLVRRSLVNRGYALLVGGFVLGLLGVSLFVAWERQVFTGLFDFDTVFRVTGPFSTMNTGGSHIEAYIALALPMMIAWVLYQRRVANQALGAVLIALAFYALLVTFSRGGYLAGAVGVTAIIMGTLLIHARRRDWAWSGAPLALTMVSIVAVLVALPVLQGSVAQARLSQLSRDLSARTQHWAHVLRIMEPGPFAQLFGVGHGQFPIAYLWNGRYDQVPGTFQLMEENGSRFLRLGSGIGDTLYIEQVLPGPLIGSYTLSLEVRGASADYGLRAAVCEKAMLYSFKCRSATVSTAGETGSWSRAQVDIPFRGHGLGTWLLSRPVKLSLYNPTGVPLDIRNVSMVAPDGAEIVRNGTFSKRLDHWLFAVDNPWPWHVENLWLDVYFAQGLLGLIATMALVVYALWKSWVRVLEDDFFALALGGGILAFLTVGIFGSPTETPRLAFLFYLTISFAALSGHPRRRGHPGATRMPWPGNGHALDKA